MATLAGYRARLRLDLMDPAGSAQRFADADLDRAILRAVGEYQRAAPRPLSAQLTTTPGSRELSLAALAGLLEVVRVEYPVGRYPPACPPFRVAPDRALLALLVAAPPAGAEPVTVDYGAAHTVDAAQSTLPADHEAIVLRGAYGFACEAFATQAGDNFRYEDDQDTGLVDDTAIPRRWAERAREALAWFRSELARLRDERTAALAARAVWSTAAREDRRSRIRQE
ncbi:MAG: hypothetical protein QN210_12295 [Armatimonadota bacterium]|nr:hypothetical protein [Armatimonadota bacterium]